MKLIFFTQISKTIGEIKTGASISAFFSSVFIAATFLAVSSPNVLAEEVGIVTAISQPTGEIDINGRSFKLSVTTHVKIEGEKQLVNGRLENISVGKSINYRQDGAVVREITILRRPIDLPLVTPPNSTTTVR